MVDGVVMEEEEEERKERREKKERTGGSRGGGRGRKGWLERDVKIGFIVGVSCGCVFSARL